MCIYKTSTTIDPTIVETRTETERETEREREREREREPQQPGVTNSIATYLPCKPRSFATPQLVLVILEISKHIYRCSKANDVTLCTSVLDKPSFGELIISK
jgi:hypothetical protein